MVLVLTTTRAQRSVRRPSRGGGVRWLSSVAPDRSAFRPGWFLVPVCSPCACHLLAEVLTRIPW